MAKNKPAGYAKTTVYIAVTGPTSTTPLEVATDLDQAAYDALDWAKINRVTQAPSMGKQSNFEGQAYIDNPTEEYFESTIARNGTTINYRESIGDQGQTALKAAGEIHGGIFALKHVLNDAPAGGTPTARYTAALIGAVQYPEGGPTDWQMASQQVQPNSETVIAEAAEAP